MILDANWSFEAELGRLSVKVINANWFTRWYWERRLAKVRDNFTLFLEDDDVIEALRKHDQRIENAKDPEVNINLDDLIKHDQKGA